MLLETRKNIAERDGKLPFHILTNDAVRELADNPVSTIDELKEIQGDAAQHDFYTHLRMSLQGGLHACEILARKMGAKLQMARKLGPNQSYLKQEAKAYSAGAAAKSCASAAFAAFSDESFGILTAKLMYILAVRLRPRISVAP